MDDAALRMVSGTDLIFSSLLLFQPFILTILRAVENRVTCGDVLARYCATLPFFPV